MSQTKAQLLDPKGDVTYSGHITGVGATFSGNLDVTGNVSIGGTLTKQDVTNVDSVGLITARSGIIAGTASNANVKIDSVGSIRAKAAAYSAPTSGTGLEIWYANDTLQDTPTGYIVSYDRGAGAYKKLNLDGSNIKLRTSGNQRLEVTSGGGVKFNDADTPASTTAPAQILNHAGGWQFYGSSDSSTHRNIIFGTNNAAAGERLRITSAGLVGIGTAIPSAYLDVESNAASGYVTEFRSVNASNSARILIDSPADNNLRPSAIVLANAGTDKWGIGQVYGSSSSKAFHICSGSASEDNSKLTIANDGLVGIATAVPADAWLDIASTAGTEAIRMRRLSSDVNVASNWAFKAYGKNLYFREGSSSPYDRVYFTDTGNVVATGAISDSNGNLRSVPLNTQASTYTLVASDVGKCILASNTVTFNTGVMSGGDAVTIINNTNGDITITQGSGAALYNTADGTTGSRTLATRGISTIYFTHNTTGYISGTGLS